MTVDERLAEPPFFLAAIRQESDRFYELAAGADPLRPVPSCPDWTIADLVGHLGEVHWFWGSDIELRATGPDQIEATKPTLPSDYADLLAWGRAQANRMIELLEVTSDEVAVWTWALESTDQNVGFIRRHQVQEAAVHRWDIENAASGQAAPIDPVAASDSIDEVLVVTLPWMVDEEKPLSGTVHLHCTDTAGEWLIQPNGSVERLHAKGAAAIRGTASDLLLGLYNRIPIDGLDLIGDRAVVDDFLGRLHTA